MRRYYFDLLDDSGLLVDDVGELCANDDVAIAKGQRALSMLAMELPWLKGPNTFEITIRPPTGQPIVLRATVEGWRLAGTN